ncbi:MAG TPA: hypothetical protein P5119_11660 [Candidatus Aminicenantes bacterium]|nr:hypothetical protein [Candidatus Aminicenantes bacterium]HRY65979.1 hypothetical protein [Candidatus Aminicenantes bacterium]HRZ72972.1 hypothetical protein [Candidatus Aminicenantes bacterium]
MKRQAAALAALALFLAAGAVTAFAQAAFKVPFPLKAAGKNLAAGEYAVVKAPDGGLVLKQAATGRETPLAVLERIPQPAPPVAEPRLVFDEVGDFAPSYTEYITVYVLAEVWLPGEDGYRVHVTKGAHKTKAVSGAAAR